MGFVGSMFDSSKGAGFQAAGTGGNEVEARNQVNNAYTQQQRFLDALSQSNPNLFSQQAGLTNQLIAQSRGEGPNPALVQLAQTTGQNTQNQAALMAGQRGIGGNPGLLARNIAQQGATLQQNAAGQAAVMRAQQQLASQQQLQQQLGQIAAQQQASIQGLGNLGIQNQGQQYGLLQNANNANAGIAGINAQNQAAMFGGAIGGVGQVAGMQGGGGGGGAAKAAMMAHGGVVPQHLAGGGPALGVTDAPLMPGVLAPEQKAPDRLNLGIDYQMPMGPQIPQAQTGPGFNVDMGINPGPNPYGEPLPETGGGGKSMLAKFGQGFSNAYGSGNNNPMYNGMSQLTAGSGALFNKAAKNIFYPSENAPTVPIKQDGKDTGEMVLKSRGGKISGNAKVSGDSEKNDTVPALLSPGEVVIPRSKVNDPKKVASFLNALLGTNLKA